jgi:cytochrome c1
MPKPLSDDQVTFDDGTKSTLDQEAKDVAAFLMWTAEPKLEERHRMGFKVVIFLVVLTGLFLAAKKRIWRDVH